MSFTEEKLEQAVIDLFKAEGYEHVIGENIHKELPESKKRSRQMIFSHPNRKP